MNGNMRRKRIYEGYVNKYKYKYVRDEGEWKYKGDIRRNININVNMWRMEDGGWRNICISVWEGEWDIYEWRRVSVKEYVRV